eukprot:3752312-Prymnesium_polylepis.1
MQHSSLLSMAVRSCAARSSHRISSWWASLSARRSRAASNSSGVPSFSGPCLWYELRQRGRPSSILHVAPRQLCDTGSAEREGGGSSSSACSAAYGSMRGPRGTTFRSTWLSGTDHWLAGAYERSRRLHPLRRRWLKVPALVRAPRFAKLYDSTSRRSGMAVE